MSLFDDLPDRNNGEEILAGWFNSIKTSLVGVFGSSDASAIYEVNSTTQGGFPAPSMTTTQRDLISTPLTGLQIYNSTTNKINVYTGSGWTELSSAAVTLPTIQKFTSGVAQTYTTPANCQWIRVRMLGGGGGGGPSGNSGGGAAGNGVTSTFGSSLLTAWAGALGGGLAVNIGGAGGTYTINGPAIGFGVDGSTGGTGTLNSSVTAVLSSGYGGNNSLGGAAPGVQLRAGAAANTNSGGGGSGGGGAAITGFYSGTGGGAGGFLDAIIKSPSATYTYTVGTGGAGGTAGVSGYAGGSGAAGIIIVEEYY